MSSIKNFFNSAADGVFAIDRKQRIIYWDRGCEELFGYSSDWVLGRPCSDVMQGCHPISNKQFCSKDCCVAKLSREGESAPKSFKIKINKENEKPVVFGVNVVLVPSECKKNWIVTHFLHREHSPGVLKSFEYAQTNHTSVTQKTSYPALATNQPKQRLTNRESQVLLLLAEGIAAPDIAQRLTVSQTTVRNHIQHILSKLCVHSRSEAVAYAYRHELI